MDISPQAESTAVVLAEQDKPGWTAERIARLPLLWIEGLSCSQIADQLGGGLTRNAIIGKAHRLYLNVSHPRKPSVHQGDIKKIRESRAERQREYWHRRQERLLAQDPNYRRPKKKPQPPLVIEEELPPAEFLALPFLDLEISQCRYARGDGPDMRFCGQPVITGHSWCRDCRKIVYRRTA